MIAGSPAAATVAKSLTEETAAAATAGREVDRKRAILDAFTGSSSQAKRNRRPVGFVQRSGRLGRRRRQADRVGDAVLPGQLARVGKSAAEVAKWT